VLHPKQCLFQKISVLVMVNQLKWRYSESLHFAHKVYVYNSYDSQNKQQLLPRIALTRWSLQWRSRMWLLHISFRCFTSLIQWTCKLGIHPSFTLHTESVRWKLSVRQNSVQENSQQCKCSESCTCLTCCTHCLFVIKKSIR